MDSYFCSNSWTLIFAAIHGLPFVKFYFIQGLLHFDLAKIEFCLVTDDKSISQNISKTIRGSRNDPSQMLEHFGLGAMELVLLELTTSF